MSTVRHQQVNTSPTHPGPSAPLLSPPGEEPLELAVHTGAILNG